VAQVGFSGGEPMRRFADLLELTQMAQGHADTWVLTSGFGLTLEKAKTLKQAGLTGILLSLDDWNPARHNHFRGSENSFAWAELAAASAKKSGLALGLSLCATREFTQPENLQAYGRLGRQWGAGFLQILEPKPLGHFANQAVELSQTQEKLLEKFYLDLNHRWAYRQFPVVTYQGFQQRRNGCSGASRRYLYVDTNGEAHACPFCRKSAGNCLTENVSAIRDRLAIFGCPRYTGNPVLNG